MPSHPTPISKELEWLSAWLAARAAASGTVGVADLRQVAEQLDALARRTAPLERFYAELVAEAAEEELKQSHAAVAGQLSRRATRR